MPEGGSGRRRSVRRGASRRKIVRRRIPRMNDHMCDFPARPITAAVIGNGVEPWRRGACPICGDDAMACALTDVDNVRFVCLTCQRFSLTTAAASAIKGYRRERPDDPARLLEGLSR